MIVPAIQKDLAECAELMADSELLRRYRVTYRSALESLQSAVEDEDVVLVARDGPIAGLAWLSFAPRVLNNAAYLRLLLVASSAQRGGLGWRLLQAGEDIARERSRHLYLLVTTDNTGARRFYERHGYVHVGDLPALVWPDLDEALYWKRL